MTYVYAGPSTLAIIGIAVISAVVTAGVIYGLWWIEGWWLERREEPGPIDPGVDGVMLEPRHDPPFPDGWHGAWTPSPADVELGRALTRERFSTTVPLDRTSTESSTGRG
jgi:hypothetical protein